MPGPRAPEPLETLVPEPHFARGRVSSAGRRLLLVSYNFTPDSSMGALRWEKLVAHGATRGWGVDVLAMDPKDSEFRDDSRLAALPEGTRVYSVPYALHPYMVAERFLRRWLAVFRRPGKPGATAPTTNHVVLPERPDESDRSPMGILRALRRAQLARLYYDEWRRWCERALDAGVRLGQETDYQLIVSSGPPQMAHEAARQIAEQLGVPHVVDFRDMWHGPTAEPWDFASPTWRRLSERYERASVTGARLVVANTAAIEEILRQRYPGIGDRLMTVMNGADPDVGSTGQLAPRFTLIHAGELYNGRDPRPLMQGLRVAIDTTGATADQLCLRFLGTDQYEGVPLEQLALAAGVADFVIVERKVPRADALRAIGESAMLVILPQNQVECIPGKVFEYVQMSSWLLAISEPRTAVDLLLRDTAADLVEPSDVAAIGALVAQRYREFTRGVRPPAVNADGRFDRSREADRLFDAFEALVERRQTR